MATRSIEKTAWEDYLNHVTRELGACLAEVEVAGLEIGDQVEADWVRLTGLSYDPKDDLVIVDLLSKDDKDFEHMVRKPTELVVDEEADGLTSLVVTGADGIRTILKLRKPLALPPAA